MGDAERIIRDLMERYEGEELVKALAEFCAVLHFPGPPG
jgi:hypothetical protein